MAIFYSAIQRQEREEEMIHLASKSKNFLHLFDKFRFEMLLQHQRERERETNESKQKLKSQW